MLGLRFYPKLSLFPFSLCRKFLGCVSFGFCMSVRRASGSAARSAFQSKKRRGYFLKALAPCMGYILTFELKGKKSVFQALRIRSLAKSKPSLVRLNGLYLPCVADADT